MEPDSRWYYANYALYLRPDSSQPNSSMHDFEQAMHLGEQLDPDNAIYNYCLARAYLQEAIVYRTEYERPKALKPHIDCLLNRNYFSKGLAEWRQGLTKSRLTWYGSEGFYLDAQGKLTWFDSTLASDALGAIVSDNAGFGYYSPVRFREVSVKVKLLALWRYLGFEILVNAFPRFRRFWEHYLCYIVRGKVMEFCFEKT